MASRRGRRREIRTAKVKGAQDAIASDEGRVQDELHRSAGHAVDGEYGANGPRVEPEAAVEVQRRPVVVWRARNDGRAEEDCDVLVVRHRVKGQERVREERNDGLVGKDFAHGRRALGLGAAAWKRFGGDERRRGLAVDKRRRAAAAVLLLPLLLASS